MPARLSVIRFENCATFLVFLMQYCLIPSSALDAHSKTTIIASGGNATLSCTWNKVIRVTGLEVLPLPETADCETGLLQTDIWNICLLKETCFIDLSNKVFSPCPAIFSSLVIIHECVDKDIWYRSISRPDLNMKAGYLATDNYFVELSVDNYQDSACFFLPSRRSIDIAEKFANSTMLIRNMNVLRPQKSTADGACRRGAKCKQDYFMLDIQSSGNDSYREELCGRLGLDEAPPGLPAPWRIFQHLPSLQVRLETNLNISMVTAEHGRGIIFEYIFLQCRLLSAPTQGAIDYDFTALDKGQIFARFTCPRGMYLALASSSHYKQARFEIFCNESTLEWDLKPPSACLSKQDYLAYLVQVKEAEQLEHTQRESFFYSVYFSHVLAWSVALVISLMLVAIVLMVCKQRIRSHFMSWLNEKKVAGELHTTTTSRSKHADCCCCCCFGCCPGNNASKDTARLVLAQQPALVDQYALDPSIQYSASNHSQMSSYQTPQMFRTLSTNRLSPQAYYPHSLKTASETMTRRQLSASGVFQRPNPPMPIFHHQLFMHPSLVPSTPPPVMFLPVHDSMLASTHYQFPASPATPSQSRPLPHTPCINNGFTRHESFSSSSHDLPVRVPTSSRFPFKRRQRMPLSLTRSNNNLISSNSTLSRSRDTFAPLLPTQPLKVSTQGDDSDGYSKAGVLATSSPYEKLSIADNIAVEVMIDNYFYQGGDEASPYDDGTMEPERKLSNDSGGYLNPDSMRTLTKSKSDSREQQEPSTGGSASTLTRMHAPPLAEINNANYSAYCPTERPRSESMESNSCYYNRYNGCAEEAISSSLPNLNNALDADDADEKYEPCIEDIKTFAELANSEPNT